jgi:hypothetical protein
MPAGPEYEQPKPEDRGSVATQQPVQAERQQDGRTTRFVFGQSYWHAP